MIANNIIFQPPFGQHIISNQMGGRRGWDSSTGTLLDSWLVLSPAEFTATWVTESVLYGDSGGRGGKWKGETSHAGPWIEPVTVSVCNFICPRVWRSPNWAKHVTVHNLIYIFKFIDVLTWANPRGTPSPASLTYSITTKPILSPSLNSLEDKEYRGT